LSHPPDPVDLLSQLLQAWRIVPPVAIADIMGGALALSSHDHTSYVSALKTELGVMVTLRHLRFVDFNYMWCGAVFGGVVGLAIGLMLHYSSAARRAEKPSTVIKFLCLTPCLFSVIAIIKVATHMAF
jgi:hypothetical protein